MFTAASWARHLQHQHMMTSMLPLMGLPLYWGRQALHWASETVQWGVWRTRRESDGVRDLGLCWACALSPCPRSENTPFPLLHQGEECGPSVAHINSYHQVSSLPFFLEGLGLGVGGSRAHYQQWSTHCPHLATSAQENMGMGSTGFALCSSLNQQTQSPPQMVSGHSSSVIRRAGLWAFSSHYSVNLHKEVPLPYWFFKQNCKCIYM